MPKEFLEKQPFPQFCEPNGLTPVFIRLPTENIALLKFIAESYDELGTMRTLDPSRGLVVFLALSDTVVELKQLLCSLKEELCLSDMEAAPNIDKQTLICGNI